MVCVVRVLHSTEPIARCPFTIDATRHMHVRAYVRSGVHGPNVMYAHGANYVPTDTDAIAIARCDVRKMPARATMRRPSRPPSRSPETVKYRTLPREIHARR